MDFIEHYSHWEFGEQEGHIFNNTALPSQNTNTYQSIRSTHSEMSKQHIAPDDGWIVEVYPRENFGITHGRGEDIYRMNPKTTNRTIRIITAMMIWGSLYQSDDQIDIFK